MGRSDLHWGAASSGHIAKRARSRMTGPSIGCRVARLLLRSMNGNSTCAPLPLRASAASCSCVAKSTASGNIARRLPRKKPITWRQRAGKQWPLPAHSCSARRWLVSIICDEARFAGGTKVPALGDQPVHAGRSIRASELASASSSSVVARRIVRLLMSPLQTQW